jgi:electron transfer flavoprotein beta subunit
MHVMVVLRLVPDTGEDFELAADGKGIDREWIGFKLNEFDDHALEQAVLLKESNGAKVTAVALQHEGVDRLLQTALARGADNVVKISNTLLPPVSAMATAQLVAATARHLECSLILTGVQTVEDLFGQLAPTLGAILDWPQVNAISGVKLERERLVVQQEYSGGFAATLALPLPAVLGIQASSAPPRYVSGSKLREVMSTKIDSLTVDTAVTTTASEIVSISFPQSTGKAEMMQGSAEDIAERLAAVLRERGFVKGPTP